MVSVANEYKDEIDVSLSDEVKVVTSPAFQPSILDKLLIKPATSDLRVNTKYVEFIGAVFSPSWIENNDQSSISDQIIISLPENHTIIKTVSSGSTAPVPEELANLILGDDSGSILVLWGPKDLLRFEKTNNNITIHFCKDLLLDYSDIIHFKNSIKSYTEDVVDTTEDDIISSAMNHSILPSRSLYQKRAQYNRDSSYAVTGVTGIIAPYSYSNNGRSFTSFHEIEIYLNEQSNTAEFISHIHDDGRYRYWTVILGRELLFHHAGQDDQQPAPYGILFLP